ncbi:MAG: hydrogenase maturation nickel metallochaperone HypA [Acidaminococcaceae bacterium]|nr:hydrogenase maturation nickel metallochaperone HypA [Acidaminococcaceae bacterium]
MHEYPVTVRIVEITSETARQKRGKVRRIDLVVGEDSGFIGDSIQMYFDVVAEGTPCEGAKLHIEGIKPQLRCESCGKYFERKRFSFQCPFCGGDGEPTEIGKEFYVKSVELEVEDEFPSANASSS